MTSILTPAHAANEHVTVLPATEDDLSELLRIQFLTVGTHTHQQIMWGAGQPEPEVADYILNIYKTQLRSEPGLKIVKAVWTGPDPAPVSGQAEGATDAAGPESKSKAKIVGCCQFFLPNFDAEREEDKLPVVVRPVSPSFRATWFPESEPARRACAEKLVHVASAARQRIRAGRLCGYVRYMCVLPAYQRLGIGKAIMEHGCDLFDAVKCDMFLGASSAGKGLYEKYGFKLVGEFREDIDGVEVKYWHMWRDAVR